MPAAPILSTTIAAGATGHVAASNTVHGIIDNIYLATIGGTHTTAVTLAQADSGEFIPINSTSTVVVTVPANLSVGTSIEIYRQNTGAVTLTASGVTFECPGTPAPRAQYSTISLLWRTATIVVVGGDYT